MKTKNKLIMSFVLIITIALSVIMSIHGMKVSKEEQYESRYSTVSSSVYEAIESEIAKPIYTSLTMANDVYISDLLQNEDDYTEEEMIAATKKYLQTMKDAMGAQTVFIISDHSKRYYTSDGLNKVIDYERDEHDIWYSIFVNTRKPYDLDIDTDQVNGGVWTVFVNARIEDKNGRLIGVCGLGISMDDLQSLLMEYETNYDVKINFIDSDGAVQVDTEDISIENAYLYNAQYGKEKDGYSYIDNNGEYIVMRYVDKLQWYLVIHGKTATITFKEVVPVLLGAFSVLLVDIIALLLLSKKEKKQE